MIILKEPTYTGEVVTYIGKEYKEVAHGWGIDFDEFNVILYKLSLHHKTGEVFKVSPEGYYTNIMSCLSGMVNKQILLDGGTVDNIKELIDVQNKWLMEICKYVKK